MDGPLGDEPLERCQIGALPGLVGRLVQFPGERRQRSRCDLPDGLPQRGDRGRWTQCGRVAGLPPFAS
ncbi:hypothetical protein FHS37_001342 [Streptomyces griseostramineus]|uniref:Uncharacterized protein n=1 Tax=Streptomyces griseomycini TaxID=66895 RepID=A0A7W7LVP4_9ACTN|nr:hypothetical protein [Streptomyces griseomycini]